MCSFISFFSLLVNYVSGFSFRGFDGVKRRMSVLSTTAVIVTTTVVYPRLKKHYVQEWVF